MSIKADAVVADIIDALKADGRVHVLGLGVFEVIECKGLGKRTLAGRTFNVGPYNKIKFKMSAGVKQQFA